MSSSSSFGDWLLGELRKRAWSQAELARKMKRTAAAINMLIKGSLQLSTETREELAQVLGIAIEDVPSALTLDENGKRPPSWYPDSGPQGYILKTLDHGIPDHTLVALAEDLGYFRQFNIKVEVEKRKERAYPEAQRKLCADPKTRGTLLLSSPLDVLPWDELTCVGCTNTYTGYTLIARASARLWVSKKNQSTVFQAAAKKEKLAAFENIFRWILECRAHTRVAFVDETAERFYKIVLELYDRLRRHNQLLSSFEKKYEEIRREYLDTPVLDTLDEIGVRHADFVVGPAYYVAVVLQREDDYKIVLAYRDLEDIIESMRDSPEFMSSLCQVSLADYDDEVVLPKEVRDVKYNAFWKEFDDKLKRLKLIVAWAINIPFSMVEENAEWRALACRIASVALRVIHQLSMPDTRAEAMVRLREYATTHDDRNARFQGVDIEQFQTAWETAYPMTKLVEGLPQTEKTGESDDINRKKNSESLAKVESWMAKKLDGYKDAIKQLDELHYKKLLSTEAEEHRSRAIRHYGIFNYWDAEFFACEALNLSKAGRGGPKKRRGTP